MAIELVGVGVDVASATILDGVDLTIADGTTTAIVGPNGAGKTTLLRTILGLVPHRGQVIIDGRAASRRHRARDIAYVPQQPARPVGMTVADYVALGRTPHLGYFHRESDRDVTAVREAMTVMDLGTLADRDIATLSGGEAQRAALARAVAQEATTLVLDEPTTGLDIGRQQEVMTLIDGLRRARSLTLITTTHDLTMAAQFADQVAMLSRGRVVHHGHADAVLTPALVAEHYGAEVSMVTDDDGHVHVVPRRTNSPRTPEETQA